MKIRRFGPDEVPNELLRRKLNAIVETLSSISGLDDYEEGTWTPVLSDGTNTDASYNPQLGNYVKIGSVVYINVSIDISSLGSISGDLQINGLPFSAKIQEGNDMGALTVTTARNLNITAGEVVVGRVFSNESFIRLQLWDSSTGVSTLQSGEMSADGRFRLNGLYFT